MFDPDAYLASKSTSVPTAFDPSAYLAKKTTPVTEKGLMTQAMEYPTKTVNALSLDGTTPQNLARMGQSAVDLFTPPTTANIPGELEKKRQILEGLGNKVKNAALESEGNITEGISKTAAKYLSPGIADAIQKIMGAWGGTAQTLTTIAPFTPGEFAVAGGAEIAPSVASQAVKPLAIRTANRWANTPKAIREGRLEKGQPTVGEDVLSLPKERVGDVAVNNKRDAWNTANVADHQLNQQIKDEITTLTKAGTPESGAVNPDLSASPAPTANGISKYEVAGVIDDVAKGLDAPDAARLMKYKEDWLRGKPDILDFGNSNAERIKLGEEIGKDFGKQTPDLAFKAEAQRSMWQFIREKLGKLSPKLDEMLGLQHKIKDIKTSIKPEAALGYEKTPDSLWQSVKGLVNRKVGLADWTQNRLPELGHTTAGATVATTKAVPLSEKIKQLRKQ